MRVFLLCATLAAAPVFAGDLVAHQGGDTVHLADAPCTSQQVLDRLEPRLHDQFKAATAIVQGRSFAACWRLTEAGAHLLYEDGDQGLVPLQDLKPEMTA